MGDRTCSVESCTRKHYARGWCQMHYERWRKAGDVGGAELLVRRLPDGTSDDIKFMAKVDQNGPVAMNRPDLGPCWIWTASKDRDGYGRFTPGSRAGGDRQSVQYAHRWSYIRRVGPVPAGLVLDHFACDTPSCVNPTHVRPVTDAENVLRGVGASARNSRKTHCPRGHPYDEANTYVVPSTGDRQCRTCRAIYRQRRRSTA